MQVAVRPSVNGGSSPLPPPEAFSRAGIALGGLGFEEPPTGWSALWQSLIGGWSTTGQQVVLNQNQARIMETTPYGTTVFQPSALPGAPILTPRGQIFQAGQNMANTLLLVAGAVVLVVLMRNR